MNVKIYVVIAYVLHTGDWCTLRAFSSLDGARVFVARREGRDINWKHHDSHGQCWSTHGYRIDELEFELETVA